MQKVNLFLFSVFLSLIMVCLVVSAVDKADVAYVYRKIFAVDKNIISVFNSLGLEVELIRDSDIRRTDFSQYKIIFVGDERFRNEEYIPIFQHPSVITNYYHGYEFGLTDPDGVSQIASTSPMSVKTDNRIVQVYTQAFYKPGVSVAIPYYYLSNLNKVDGFRKIAATYHGDNYDLGSVIAYADAQTSLLNGKYTEEKTCFFGIVESEFWTPAAKQMFKDCINFVAIRCYDDEDCDDNNEATVDTCINPGTIDSYCKHDEIVCFKDEDCGQDGFIGQPYCAGYDVYQDYKDFTCENPGTFDSSCSYEVYEKFKKTCSRGCENGACIDEHDIGIKIYGDYINGVKLVDSVTSETILDDPAALEDGGKYKIKFKIINSGSFDEEVEYVVSIMQGSNVVYEFSPGTMTLGSGETSSDRTRTWDINLARGEYNILVAVNIIGFQDNNPEDNIVLRYIVIGEPIVECQDTLELKPGLNLVSLKCQYEENDIQSLFAGKMEGEEAAVDADMIWKLVPGENDYEYETAWQIDYLGVGSENYNGKWWNPGTEDFSTLSFEPGDGFWIENKYNEKTLILNGQEPGQITYNFKKGNNIFGVAEKMTSASFLELVPECHSVRDWQPDEEYWNAYLSSYEKPHAKYWIVYPESGKYSAVYHQEYDINTNGRVDVYDAISIKTCSLGNCDLNNNGRIDEDDFFVLLGKVGLTDYENLEKYDIDKNKRIEDYDALAVFTCSLGECDIDRNGKIDEDDRQLVLEHQQYNIGCFDLEPNRGYWIECDKDVSLSL